MGLATSTLSSYISPMFIIARVSATPSSYTSTMFIITRVSNFPCSTPLQVSHHNDLSSFNPHPQITKFFSVAGDSQVFSKAHYTSIRKVDGEAQWKSHLSHFT
jgi:hypothetical protein